VGIAALRCLLFIGLMLGFAVPSLADVSEGGAIGIDGVSHALNEWQALADVGDRRAQAALGEIYFQGIGVAKDAALALTWWRKAADQGEPHAELRMGLVYHTGSDVGRNDAAAIAWLRRAADQGDAGAEYNLGQLFDEGQQISDRDPLWSQIATNPDWRTQNPGLLATLHAQGTGERAVRLHDYPEAVRWYRAAIAQGHAGAMLNLGNMYRDGRGVRKDGMEATRLYRAAAGAAMDPADPVSAMAAINLAVVYERGEIVGRDYASAAVWMRRALANPSLPASAEFSAAQELAAMYAGGRGVPRDEEEAERLRARADIVGQKLRQAVSRTP
jgi:uncharacterized protein